MGAMVNGTLGIGVGLDSMSGDRTPPTPSPYIATGQLN